MSWNSDRFEREFNDLETESSSVESPSSGQTALSSDTSLSDNKWSSGFSSKAAKMFDDDWGNTSSSKPDTSAPANPSSELDNRSSGFSSKAAKMFDDDWGNTSSSKPDTSAQANPTFELDNWSSGFSSKAAKMFDDDWDNTSSSKPDTSAPANPTSELDNWSSGFSSKAAKMFDDDWGSDSTKSSSVNAFDDHASTVTTLADNLSTDASIDEDISPIASDADKEIESSGFSSKAAQYLDNDFSHETENTLSDSTTDRFSEPSTFKTRADNMGENWSNTRNASWNTTKPQKAPKTNAHQHQIEQKSSQIPEKPKSQASLSTGNSGAKWPDNNGGAFHAEDKSSLSGKATSAAFHAEDKSSLSGKATSAAFHAEDKSSKSGKATSASWGDTSDGGDWQSTGIKTEKSLRPVVAEKPAAPKPAPKKDYISGYSDSGCEVMGVDLYSNQDDELNDWLKTDDYRSSVSAAAPVERKMEPTRTKPHMQLYHDEDVSSAIWGRSFFNFVAWCVLIIGGPITLFSGHIFVAIILVVSCLAISSVLRKSRTKIMKDSIVFDQLKKYFNAKTYRADEDINAMVGEISPFYMYDRSWNSGILSDFFNGSLNENPFKFYDVQLQKTVDNKKVDVFRGQLITFKMAHRVNMDFIIKQRLYGGSANEHELNALRVLGFSPNRDCDLINRFSIELDNEIKGNNAVSIQKAKIPKFYEALYHIQSKFNGRCYLRVHDGIVYFTLERNYDPFEYTAFDIMNGVESMRVRVSKETQEIYNIVSELMEVAQSV